MADQDRSGCATGIIPEVNIVICGSGSQDLSIRGEIKAVDAFFMPCKFTHTLPCSSLPPLDQSIHPRRKQFTAIR
jgi:hypothetical protein